jgi:hypothetical protein
MGKYFAVSYLEIGLGLETFKPRKVFRAFIAEEVNQIDFYLMREHLPNISLGAIQSGEIYPRRVLTKSLEEDHIVRGEMQITEVPEEIALKELRKLKWKRINVSQGLDEFLDAELMR